MVESFRHNKNTILKTFVCALFFEWEVAQSLVVKAEIRRLREHIASKTFWDDVGDVYHVMMPVMLALQKFDCRAPNMGKFYMAWWTICKSLKKPKEPQESYVKL